MGWEKFSVKPRIDIGSYLNTQLGEPLTQRRSRQVVRQWFAKPSFVGSIPTSASKVFGFIALGLEECGVENFHGMEGDAAGAVFDLVAAAGAGRGDESFRRGSADGWE